jgi:hypothetical protein
MELSNITFVGGDSDDADILSRLPASLSGLLRQINGFVQFHGGLHVRGACREPAWHSLRDAWEGERALCELYDAILANDVPFAEDCMGDQFLLRDEIVHRLSCETGELKSLDVRLGQFLEAAEADPMEVLGLHPLQQFIRHNGRGLEQGELLMAYPPFCAKEAEDGVSLSAVPTAERRLFLARLARTLGQVSEGGALHIKVVD